LVHPSLYYCSSPLTLLHPPTLILPRPPSSTLFPYTTLFRSRRANLQQPGTDWGQRALQPGLAAGGGFGWHGICVLGRSDTPRYFGQYMGGEVNRWRQELEQTGCSVAGRRHHPRG